jgi:acetyl/propionyl-CoA carboxylase alpha subunit
MIEKILIANRGEIAVRIARTCKRLGIPCVAVYSDADRDSMHVQSCDEAVHIGPSPVTASYLNAEAILQAARETGATAIHPGYGLLSENASFARSVQEAGITFVGPSPETLAILGDKVSARHLATQANVRVVPGSGDPVSDLSSAREQAEVLEYPVLVKAVQGGGGIGMKIAHEESELQAAITACSDRGKQAFGDGRVFIEKYIERPRHVEIQFLVDHTGEAVALGERECSVQRRHQKILEESPAPALASLHYPDDTREAMCEAALRIAKESKYLNAGTCEFILDARGRFYFLEVNARLQVEHPVTEMCTGLDLVELQLQIANREPLPPAVLTNVPTGHAIEARIYAENPAKNFAPSPGNIDECRWPPAPHGKVRIETAVGAGSVITPYYDPMIAKIVVYESSRHQAILLLDRMLAETTISPLTTNIAFLRTLINDESFRAGQYDTSFVDIVRNRPQ